jgi:hypothetical protein
MQEPSVLDYIKAKFTFWRESSLEFPITQPPGTLVSQELESPAFQESLAAAKATPKTIAWPWRAAVALSLALIAQISLEPPNRSITTAILFYLMAAVWLIWANWVGEWVPASWTEQEYRSDPLTVRLYPLLFGILMALIAFLTMGGNLFTLFNVSVWFLAIASIMRAFWLDDHTRASWSQRLSTFIKRPHWNLTISRWTLLMIAASALVIFFRYYQLNQVPPEMFSDHAEKLLDISDVLNGQTHIFFPRNTGREAVQMYLTAAVALIFGTGLSFTSLKIGTITAGLLTLPFIYLLGKEIANRRVGLLAVVFAGIAYWPNVISRVALRFTLYPFFFAPTLYFLIRGLRRSSRNDFILAGLALGLGLHGYTSFRVVPFVVLAAVGLYLLHKQSKGLRIQTLWSLGALVGVSLVVFLPLVRVMMDPELGSLFMMRTLSRISGTEAPLPSPAWQIFLQNLWNGITMFFYSNGETWVHSIPYRPALGVVSASLFFLGCVFLVVRYFRQRNWLDLFLLVSIPLLLMPSVLSLAFPRENPSLNRTGGAIVPVFLIVGLSLDGLLTGLAARWKSSTGKVAAWGLVLFLLAWSSFQNYDLVFNQYFQEFRMSAWNTSEMGQVIRGFADSVGSLDSAWVIPYPYWADTRLVGINAGYPTKDYAIPREKLAETLATPGPKLFIFNLEDQETLIRLHSLYPQGWLQEYKSKVPTKDFLIYFVPSTS